MCKLDVIITPTAELDLQSIFEYIAKDNLHKAEEMLNVFEDKFNLLAVFPNSGVKKVYFIKRDVRLAIVAKHYQIIYVVKDEILYVLRVLSGYQDIFPV